VNFSRGFFRLWLIFSLLWIALGFAFLWNSTVIRQSLGLEGLVINLQQGPKVNVELGASDSELEEIFEKLPWNRYAKDNPAKRAEIETERLKFKALYRASERKLASDKQSLLLVGTGYVFVPIVLLFLGLAFRWVAAGFQRKE
jgi:acylphosphatase